MKFSEHFQIQSASDENWFDPILSMDTKLFLDPFLIYANESGHFIGNHQEVVSFFNSAFQRKESAVSRSLKVINSEHSLESNLLETQDSGTV